MVKVFAWSNEGTRVTAQIQECKTKDEAVTLASDLVKKYRNVMIAETELQIKTAWHAIGARYIG